jgi:nicotinamidase-related amidase
MNHGGDMKPALLVIDMQKAFYNDPLAKASMDDASDCINPVLSWFREKALPVYWIHHTTKEGPFEGAEDFEFIDRLDKNKSEPRIVKRYGNSFNKTGLYAQLSKQAVDTVFVTGFCAEYCVLSTYRGARDLDLTSILIRGASASGNAEHIGFVERISEIMSVNIVKSYIGFAG